MPGFFCSGVFVVVSLCMSPFCSLSFRLCVMCWEWELDWIELSGIIIFTSSFRSSAIVAPSINGFLCLNGDCGGFGPGNRICCWRSRCTRSIRKLCTRRIKSVIAFSSPPILPVKILVVSDWIRIELASELILAS